MKKQLLLFTTILLSCLVSGSYAQSYRNHLLSGNGFYNTQQYDSAIVQFSKAIKADPGQAEAYKCRGSCYLKKEKFDNAIVDYSMAIRIDPKFGEAYYYRGMARKHKDNLPANYCDDFIKAKECGYKEAKKAIKEFCKQEL